MNLSTYLQMPPAPVAAQGTSNPAAQGAAALAGQAAGASLGFDFAQVMAKQMVRFNPQQRQEFAASPATSSANDVHLDERDTTQADTHIDTTQDVAQSDDRTSADGSDRSSSPATRRSNKTARTVDNSDAGDPLAAAMTQIAAVVSPTVEATSPASSVTPTTPDLGQAPAIAQVPPTASSPTAAEAASPDVLSKVASQLRTVELSPRVRIITAPQQAPNPESLMAFAKSMGLDDGAIQSLMGQAAPGGTSLPSGLNPSNSSANASQLAAAQLTGGGTPQGTVTADGLQALTSATLQNAQVSVTPAVTTPASPPVTAEFAHGSLLPVMSPADMASIQQLQVTVLPPAPLPVANAVAGTSLSGTQVSTEPLSLLGGHVLEQDIAELASGFSDSGTDMGADSQSGESAQSGFGFGQAMAGASTSDKTSLSKTANTPATQSMSDTYDQLSDKLSTEMAARIHKQLSDGQWKMKFGLRPENLGGVEIQLEMKNGKLDAVFRADNPLTRDLLQNSSQRLRDALENFGIQAGLVHIGQDGSGAQHRQSGHSTNQPQVGHNSPTQVSQAEDVVSATTETSRNKANASLLDLYA